MLMHSPAVPHYYFHLHNQIDVDDDEGTDLSDADAAREYAVLNLRDLICADVRKGYLNLGHHIEVVDEQGAPVLSLAFRDAFTLEG